MMNPPSLSQLSLSICQQNLHASYPALRQITQSMDCDILLLQEPPSYNGSLPFIPGFSGVYHNNQKIYTAILISNTISFSVVFISLWLVVIKVGDFHFASGYRHHTNLLPQDLFVDIPTRCLCRFDNKI